MLELVFPSIGGSIYSSIKEFKGRLLFGWPSAGAKKKVARIVLLRYKTTSKEYNGKGV